MGKELRKAKKLFKKGTSLEDKIWLATVKPQEYTLTDHQEQIKERWRFCFTQKLNGNGRLQIAKHLVDEYEISEGQAYQDIKNADHFYGNVFRADQQAEKAVLYELARQTYEKAVSDGNLKLRLKAIELMGRFSDIGKDDIQQFNPEKFENKEMTIAVPKQVMEILMDKLAKGVVDFNLLDAEDAKYVDITETEEDAED